MGTEAEQGILQYNETTSKKPENELRQTKADKNPERSQNLDAYKDLIVQLRSINLLIQKQCKAPMGEIVSLLTIQHLCKAEGEISVSAVGEKMHLSRPAISRMIHTLKRKGYIEFHQGRKDHRYNYIVLTEAGKHLINEEMNRCMRMMKQASEKMGQEDMEHFLYYSGRFFRLLS